MTDLSNDEKRALLEARLRAFALDSFGHQLNRQVAVTAGDEAGMAAADAAIDTIQSMSAVYQQELAALPEAPALP